MAYNDAGQARGLLSGRLWYNQQAFRCAYLRYVLACGCNGMNAV